MSILISAPVFTGMYLSERVFRAAWCNSDPTISNKGWDWCSGYHYSDSILIGFSHTHLSGTGCTDLGDILIMPLNEIRTPRGNQDDIRDGYASKYSHDNEIARPEYYSLILDRYNIKAELTATDRVGFHRYTYPEGKPASILIDLREGNGSNATTAISAK